MATLAARKAETERRRSRNAMAKTAIRGALRGNETLTSEVVEPLLERTNLDQDELT